ncbi:MAG: DUF1501 domain-containing protein [Bacteroidetes bacterium]|nr:MAG: DUF1501 domain-containing protein [Bacteroidota bacterium]
MASLGRSVPRRGASRGNGLPPPGRDLRVVADLILSGVKTRVFYVSLSGFDTHVRQSNQQARLLGQYGEAVAALAMDLQAHGEWDSPLILTFSEFGRRVAENASGGTDHGKTNALWLLGGRLRRPGAYNSLPELQQLDGGDLPWAVDLRQVYASVLRDWLAVDPGPILGPDFAPLPLL